MPTLQMPTACQVGLHCEDKGLKGHSGKVLAYCTITHMMCALLLTYLHSLLHFQSGVPCYMPCIVASKQVNGCVPHHDMDQG